MHFDDGMDEIITLPDDTVRLTGEAVVARCKCARARYITKARLDFNPFSSGSTLGFLAELKAKSVREAVPKMEVTINRVTDAAAPPRLMLTFVDGRETPVDLGKLSVKDAFAQIELETGRLDLEAMRRGKPWL
ncbi:hypothetical protein EMIHUDRAFT_114158 [Emiliania huxleyi CCMP1516]|uniref:Large ribosomal subunit protein mL53 n=2 Tax=Emiliania huxleyi TaxID=2903 RepID=A0A0D3JYR1_EMIH1|nr:hypothetical protein EMIHUDRAFT_114158 [Emiliania huxleyi CCMP1516]EOD28646.1 hypothetical protein EMIHUDRAFT_114158 [Emiliania huxleyi CCMP1516]|eukprot:XP_005781075.1 hypothetical protein EMIHUDRAFT_114158 [Emiliania huxleyi CCMP1516]